MTLSYSCIRTDADAQHTLSGLPWNVHSTRFKPWYRHARRGVSCEREVQQMNLHAYRSLAQLAGDTCYSVVER